MGTHRARLSGYDGTAHRGVDCSVSPRGQSQPEFCGGPLISAMAWRLRGGSRSDRARGRGHQTQSPGSGDGDISRRYRGCPLYGRAVCGSASIRVGTCGYARAFRARSVCAVPAWPRRGVSMKREHSCNGPGSTPTIARLDQSQRSLSDTRIDGALSGGHAEGGPELKIRVRETCSGRSQGLPVRLALSAGATHDNRLAAKLLSQLKPGSMLLAPPR